MKQETVAGILKYLMHKDDYVSGKEISIALNISEKTVLKYLNQIRDEILSHGADIEVLQGRGSRLAIHDPNLFNQYINSICEKENEFLNNPQSRKAYVLMKLLTDGNYIDLYELADELYISPSLLRSIIREISVTVEKYGLTIDHSHKNGYRIIGPEDRIRRCLSQECRDIQSVISVISDSSEDLSQKLTGVIADSLHRFGMAMSSASINSLKLHILIAINRIETDHPIQFRPSFDLYKLQGTPEYFVATSINRQLRQLCGTELSDNELLYLTMHINGKQRLNEHQVLKVKVSEEDIVFCNKFLRNIYRLADVDFFDDEELRISLLNHIVPFRNRVKNGMQINRKDLESIQYSFPYAYELALLGLSMFDENEITPSETAYFSLHLELSLEKNLQTDQQYNLTVITDEINNLYQIISFKLNKQLGNLIEKIKFTTLENLDEYRETTDLFINVSDASFIPPANTVNTSPLMTAHDLEQIQNALSSIHSRQRLEKLINPNLYIEIQPESWKECIDMILSEIRPFITLPDNFRQLVIEREKLGTTEYKNNIAVPHAITTENIPDFLTVAHLRKPIIWKEKPVSLVFLLSSSNSKTSAWFLERIGKAVQSPSIAEALMNAQSYKAFMSTFLSI